MNDALSEETPAHEVAATAAPTKAQAKAQELADIAAQSAKYAGVDVTITPRPEVLIQLGDSPRPMRCFGVQFDQEYLLVLTPIDGWRALKIDPVTRSVVLHLLCWRGFRSHVVRILTALIYDRLKAEQDRFEPRIAVLQQPEASLQLTSVPDPPVFPAPKRSYRVVSPPIDPATPPAPESDRVSATASEPGPAPRPGKPKRPQATTEGKASPSSGQVRR
jgi:hypothetical protein